MTATRPALGVIAFTLAVTVPLLRAMPPELDRDPINYGSAEADNPVSRLQAKLAGGAVKLERDDDRGYLKSLLAALQVPVSSQVLVFSKTSLQRDRIGPKTPRAIYFNDDVYVGFCLRGDVLEVSAADPVIGSAFYTLDQEPADRPRFTRHTDNCLICHASSLIKGTPGHLLRSVVPDRDGNPVLSAGTYQTTPATPFEKRWGGWYVTGTHGKQAHRGNSIAANRRPAEDGSDTTAGQNVTDLKDRFTVGNYLTPHSDIVALMVLAHQADVHNRIARAAIETRSALHYQAELNKALKEPPTHKFDSVAGRIRSVADDLVKGLLSCEEAELTGRVEGTAGFATEFAARGPFDKQGRSLRQFDLTRRLFRFPCSFLIYSEAFTRLPAGVKDPVLRKLHGVLSGKDTDPAFAHLSAADRVVALDILRDTLPGLPAYWRE